MSPKSPTRNERVRATVKDFALHLTTQRAFKRVPTFLTGETGVLVLVTPETSEPHEHVNSARLALFGEEDETNFGPVASCWFSQGDTLLDNERKFKNECEGRPKALVICPNREDIPRNLRLALDWIVDVEPVRPGDLKAACSEILDMNVSYGQAKRLLKYPLKDLVIALRPWRPVDETLRRLRREARDEPISEPEPVKRAELRSTPRLEDMHGYGPAKEWGLQLAKDLADWRAGILSWDDVDRGLLLSGPPGVGKTIFAQALAKTCGVTFVASSLGQWQAKGHLGDLLKLMRSDFARAKAEAPSILFVDELDSFGDRESFDSDNKSYSVQVVNAFLECLDGAGGREGVVVIGATNNPSDIDPAIRRAGRLDKHVAIPLPSADDRIAIIESLIGEVPFTYDRAALAMQTQGMTGADLAKMVRDAKRAARLRREPLNLADLTANLPELVSLAGDFRRSVAVHEAGHAIVGRRLSCGEFLFVEIADQLNPRVHIQRAGGAVFQHPTLRFRGRQSYLDEICLQLAGIAAEQILFGSHGDGAGIGPDSDLGRATGIAMRIEMQIGMGDSLVQRAPEVTPQIVAAFLANPTSARKIDDLLQTELNRAREILMAEQELLFKITDELDQGAIVTAERMRVLEEEGASRRLAS
ncbi:AAA family ATPase [Rhizobium ruizarguesonis]|uniref:AAA family ATPase n=1 Tax=Rhizobium ruizarguesonis TaxID=2081791 RepID=A0AAE8QDK0_9HYPH|nr:AAA family ATPase [Rhizobium ruizarguesonis]